LGESMLDTTAEIGDSVVDVLLDDVMTGVSDAASNLFWTSRQRAAEKLKRRGYKTTSEGHGDDDPDELTPFEMLTLNSMVRRIQRQYRRRKGISLELPSEQSRGAAGSTATAGMESDRPPPYDHVGVPLSTHEVPTHDVDPSTAHLEGRPCADVSSIESNEPPVTRVRGDARRRHKVQWMLGDQEPSSHQSLAEQGRGASDACAMTRVRSARRLQPCESTSKSDDLVDVPVEVCTIVMDTAAPTPEPSHCSPSDQSLSVSGAPAMARILRRASSQRGATRRPPRTCEGSDSKSDALVDMAMASVRRRCDRRASSRDDTAALTFAPLDCPSSKQNPSTGTGTGPGTASLVAAQSPGELSMARVARRASRSSRISVARPPQAYEGSSCSTSYDRTMARVRSARRLQMSEGMCERDHRLQTGEAESSNSDALKAAAVGSVAPAAAPTPAAHARDPLRLVRQRVLGVGSTPATPDQPQEEGTTGERHEWNAIVPTAVSRVQLRRRAPPARSEVWHEQPSRAPTRMSTVQRISDGPGQMLQVQELERCTTMHTRRTTMHTRRTTTIRQLTERGFEEMTEETETTAVKQAVKQERRMSRDGHVTASGLNGASELDAPSSPTVNGTSSPTVNGTSPPTVVRRRSQRASSAEAGVPALQDQSRRIRRQRTESSLPKTDGTHE